MLRKLCFAIMWSTLVLSLMGFVLYTGFVPGNVVQTMGQGPSVTMPGIMYHHVLADSGKLGDYVIAPEQLESDFAYIKSAGYTAVLPREIAAAEKGSGTLPEKPILITFDDGHMSTFYYAFPLLKKYDLKASVAVIGELCQIYTDSEDHNPAYAYCAMDDLRRMHESGIVEVASHTFALHELSGRRGVLRKKGESMESYKGALLADLTKNQEFIKNAIGIYPTTFVYPYGFIEPDADSLLEELGFTATVGVYEQLNTITPGDPEVAQKLCRYNRPARLSTKEFFAMFES